MSRTVTFTIKAKPGKIIELKSALTDFIGPSRTEEGCLNYHITQSVKDPSVFMVYMIWQDEYCLQAHEDVQKLRDFRENVAPKLIVSPIQFEDWDQLG